METGKGIAMRVTRNLFERYKAMTPAERADFDRQFPDEARQMQKRFKGEEYSAAVLTIALVFLVLVFLAAMNR